MYERAKLVNLLEECIQDAKNITIYRDLQPSLITCLFNARLAEAKTAVKVVVPEVVETPVEPVKLEEPKVEDKPEEPVKVEEKAEPETPKEEKSDEETKAS